MKLIHFLKVWKSIEQGPPSFMYLQAGWPVQQPSRPQSTCPLAFLNGEGQSVWHIELGCGSVRAHRLSLCEAPGSIQARARISIRVSHWLCTKMVASPFFWLAYSPASNSVFSFRFQLQLSSDCYRRPCSGLNLPWT